MTENTASDVNNYRLIFRPTKTQYADFMKLMATGKYKYNSELLRVILNIGIKKLQEE